MKMLIAILIIITATYFRIEYGSANALLSATAGIGTLYIVVKIANSVTSLRHRKRT